MANLKNINFMSKTRFDSTTTSDEELYLVDYGDIDVVVESYDDGTIWYRKYKSGWIVQGGYMNNGYSGSVVFKKPYKKTPSVQITLVTSRDYASHDKEKAPNSVTTTGFTITNVGGNSSNGGYWEAKGYMA